MTDQSTPTTAHDAPTHGLLLGHTERPASEGATFPVINPATGATIAHVADATADDARAALDAAVSAQATWAATTPRDRAEVLRRAFELIAERRDDLAALMTAEMGKPLDEARGEVTYGNEFFRWFSEEAVRIAGRYTHSPSGAGRILTTKAPVGPVLAITPWNFPLAMGTRKIAPALAAGCPVILKPAQLTPLTSLELGRILREAGLPDGLLSVLPSSSASRISETLLDDERLRKITFTGSTEVGKHLHRAAADSMLRVSLELGGNAPFLVFDDADLDAAITGLLTAKFRNNGEVCIAANRILVHEAVADAFVDKLVAAAQELPVGNGAEDGVRIGPLVSAEQRDSVAELVAAAEDDGATVAYRSEIPSSGAEAKGFFCPVTVLTDVPRGSRIVAEEIFGPVAPVVTFRTEEEAVEVANDTRFGLSAYLYTTNLDRAFRVAEQLESGMVGVNRGAISDVAAPFGGVKESGIGREGGVEGIEEFLETTYLALP